jgi:mRNA interferase RelE/StbE
VACWKIEFKIKAKKELNKLDKQSQQEIQRYLNETILNLHYPKQLGKALRYDLKAYWRYRVNKFRIVCELYEDRLVILVIKIAKRDVVYED